MPTCSTESLSKLLQAGAAGSGSTTPVFPGTSPTSPSPLATLRRSKSAASPTTFFREPFVIQSDWRQTHTLVQQPEKKSLLVRLIGWYPCFLLQMLRAVITIMVPAACVRTLIALPTLWFSGWLYLISRIFDFPFSVMKWTLALIHRPSFEFFRKKRTVVVSGGSTVQALHLARNFYSAGARVVVCETEGLFSLARFSVAVSKFYTLPKPTADNPSIYVRALCDIIEKEAASYYIPVNSSSSPYFDAMAKPMLELLGCTCFCPGVKEIRVLDDTFQVLHHCVDMGIPTPPYYRITSKTKLTKLYLDGTFRSGRNVMTRCGAETQRERYKIVLPPHMYELKIPSEVSEAKPWVVVQELPGEQFVTCTTVKESQVIANVTCRLDENKCLIPLDRKDIEDWLKNFFSKLNLLRPISGHLTFKFIVPEGSSAVLPLSCRVGVSLPYICHTSVHPRLLWKPCKHFSRQNSGPVVVNKGLYWMHQALLNTIQKPSVQSLTNFIGSVLDKREALFVYWDPLPYCAFYHMQLPFRNIVRFLQERRFKGTMAAPVD